jgi:hypothetical protein
MSTGYNHLIVDNGVMAQRLTFFFTQLDFAEKALPGPGLGQIMRG